ncbi:DUF4331 domain-containing protein [Rhizohabitans arisaemae]|uniref:DUF4331 domain-containing protein n=1 Tax=Rhizohabitans arisaemae TaxID=2720610 RepID=UPI0024B16348|nr:DUF4331 domain-containing protein [Rhizohabitans arisaemae]
MVIGGGFGRNGRVVGTAVVAGLAVAGGFLAGPLMGGSTASSHWDAPLMVTDPQVDATDLYAFTSPDAPETITVIVNYQPFELPRSPIPYRFAVDTHYDVNVDNTGDGTPDLVYRWTFRDEDRRGLLPFVTGPVTSLTSPHLRFRQHYTLERLRPGSPPETLVRDAIAAPSHLGPPLMPDYDKLRREAIRRLPGGGQTYAGQAADPFYTNLKATALIRFGVPVPPINVGTPLNVSTMVLQVPKSELALRGDSGRNPVVGVWATAARRSVNVAGGSTRYVQVSRVGNATFNEVFVRCPVALPCGANDRYNASAPVTDRSTPELYEAVLHPARPKAIEPFTGVRAPAEPRRDLEEVWLRGITGLNSHALNRDAGPAQPVAAEELRLNMGTPVSARPARLGYLAGDRQGFPNGRRLDDDVSPIVLGILEGALTGPGLPGVGAGVQGGRPTKPVTSTFPYLATPL